VLAVVHAAQDPSLKYKDSSALEVLSLIRPAVNSAHASKPTR